MYVIHTLSLLLREVSLLDTYHKQYLRFASYFLEENSTLTCQVTGARHYSINLPQGGLEIPCKLIFYGESRLIVEVQNLLQEALTSGLLTSCNMDSERQKKKSSLQQPKKKRRIEQGDSKSWVKLWSSMELSFHSWTRNNFTMWNGLMTIISTLSKLSLRSSSHTLMGGRKHYYYTTSKRK